MIPIYPANFPDIDQNSDTTVIFRDVDDPTIQVRRTGSCNRCGQCCIDNENIFQVRDGNDQPIDEPLLQVVPGKCAYFRWSDDGLAMCTGRDTLYYQNGCRWWPSKPIHPTFYDKCGYKFENITQ